MVLCPNCEIGHSYILFECYCKIYITIHSPINLRILLNSYSVVLIAICSQRELQNLFYETGVEEVDEVDVQLVAYNGNVRERFFKSKGLSLNFVAGLKNTIILGTLSLGLSPSPF